MSEASRRRALTGARTVAGAILAVGAVVAVTAGVLLPWPAVTRAPLSVLAAPTPADTLAVCDGPLLAAGRQATDAGEITVAARSASVVGSAGDVRDLALDAPDVEGDATVSAFAVAPEDGTAIPLTAAASARVTASDLSGFSADACRAPLFESWLVGGSTTTGSADLVLLSNPGDVTATVQLTVYGADGPTTPPGGTDVAIPARTQHVIPLAGLALGEDSPVVRVTAAGAPVRASLQSSIVRTLVPGGVDQQSAVPAAAATQVLPGVVVPTAPGEAGASETTTILRVLAPTGGGDAVVRVTAVGQSTPARPEISLPLEAGKPSELDLSGLAVGTYTVTVSAEVPIVSALWQTTGFAAGSDFAWWTPAPALAGATDIAVPSGPGAALQLVNVGADPATVTVRTSGAADRTVSLAADGGSATVPVSAGRVWTVDPAAATGVHAGVTFSAAGVLAAFPVWSADAAAPAVRVYP